MALLTTYVIDTATPLTMVLSETTNGVTTTYWHGLNPGTRADVLAQKNGAVISTFHYNGLGSVRQLADDAGVPTLSQTFDPYGNGFSKAGSADTVLGYTGEQEDSSGFVFLRARYYNPANGRFFQTDPSRLEQNPYLYGLSNRILHTDPSGTCPPCVPVVIVAGYAFSPGLLLAVALIAIAILALNCYDYCDDGKVNASYLQPLFQAIGRVLEDIPAPTREPETLTFEEAKTIERIVTQPAPTEEPKEEERITQYRAVDDVEMAYIQSVGYVNYGHNKNFSGKYFSFTFEENKALANAMD